LWLESNLTEVSTIKFFFFTEVHPEPEITSRSRVHSFTAGFKKPFRRKNKDSPKSSPGVAPKSSHSPVPSHHNVATTDDSPLLKNKIEKQPETTNNVRSAPPRPKRPPPPKPPPYRKKSATYAQLEENSSEVSAAKQSEASGGKQPDSLTRETAQLFTEKSGEKQPEENDKDSEELPALYEVPVSQQSTLETITEGDGTKPVGTSLPVAPPRRRKKETTAPKVAPKPLRADISLGKIPKAPSAPFLYNGDSSSIATHKTSDIVAAMQPVKYTEEALQKCTVSD